MQTPLKSKVPNWDFLSESDFQSKITSHWGRMVCRAFCRYIPAHSKVLEIGCGSGKITVAAAKHLGADAWGIDINHKSVAYAGKLADYAGTHAEFLVGSGFSVPFANEIFDVVISEGVIEHFPPEDTEQMVREHVRVCKPGGRVIISVPNVFNLPLTYHKWRVGENYMAYPERSYTLNGLAKLLRKTGLQPIAYSGFAPTVGLEWYIHPYLKIRFPDSFLPTWLLARIGHEFLIVAEKKG
jgi:2-polyprenyl-3-methyl-5-hydroxy-6-metoxy-1,4-benzoquinol methylase